MICGGACYDLASDMNHCGDCATACGANQACVNSACFTCSSGQTGCSAGAVSYFAGVVGMAGNTNAALTASKFNLPYGIEFDNLGNMFIVDSFNHTIREIASGATQVTTLAGLAGSSGSENGTGVAAKFYNPTNIVSDHADHLFVADSYNHAIRQIVVSTGVVTTLAGTSTSSGNVDGTGAAAHFTYPFGIALDGGNLYVADYGTHTVRQVVISTAVVTTLAGSGTVGSMDGTGTAAQFGSVVGITTDHLGNLFVTDGNSHNIRKIVIATKAVTTLAGGTTAGHVDAVGAAARFNTPYDITYDGGNLYVAENGNHDIRKVIIGTGAVTTFAGVPGSTGSSDGTNGAAKFNGPVGIDYDGAGNLWISDTHNDTIRKMTIGGVCSALTTDVFNCGGCGIACALGQTCSAGACN